MTHLQSTIAVSIALLLLGAAGALAQAWDREGTHVILVAKKGGDFNSIQAAIDSITNATADYPYLVYVAPGVYEEQVHMKEYVDIEGAGEELTRITTTGKAYTVRGVYSRISSLTIESDGGSAVYHFPWEITQVTIRARGGSGIRYCAWAFGFLKDVNLDLSSGQVLENECACCGAFVYLEDVFTRSAISGTVWLTIRDSTVGSIYSQSTVDLNRVELGGGMRSYDGPVAIRHSLIHGSIGVFSPNARDVRIAYSQVDGEVDTHDGDLARCFSVHDAELNPLDENCQPIPPPGEDPRADFTFSVSGLTVQFQNQSTGTVPLSYSWAFGDGTTSTEANPTHVYATSGSYTVTLTVTNALGVDSIQRTVTVEH